MFCAVLAWHHVLYGHGAESMVKPSYNDLWGGLDLSFCNLSIYFAHEGSTKNIVFYQPCVDVHIMVEWAVDELFELFFMCCK